MQWVKPHLPRLRDKPGEEFRGVGHCWRSNLAGLVAEVESVTHQSLAQVQRFQELEASWGLLTLEGGGGGIYD